MRRRLRLNTPMFIAIGGLIDIAGTLRHRRRLHVSSSREQDIENINKDGQRAIRKIEQACSATGQDPA